MSLKITNKTKQLLAVPLNGGDAIHLAPGESSDPVDEVETQGSEKIEKLLRGGLIEVALAEDQSAAGSSSRKKSSKQES